MNSLVNKVLSQMGNRYLDLDANSHARLDQLEAKTLCINISDWDLDLYCSVENGRLKLYFAQQQDFDARLSGTAKAMLGLGLSTRKEDKFFSQEVKLSGQMAIGQQFQALFQELDIDWEEHLSAVVGDHLAHPIFMQLTGFKNWLLNTGDNLRQDVGEYLREESLQLPYQDEVDEFRQQVSQLRDDVERLDQRIKRLSKAKLR